MKKTVKLILALAVILLFFAGCPQTQNSPTVPKNSEQYKIDSEVEKVKLDVPNRANITAGELKQKDIASSDYDEKNYAIKYEKIEPKPAELTANITFFLKKNGITSKKRTETISGFKAPDAIPTAQEIINGKADKIILTVTEKERITADELPSQKDKIKADGYNTADYTINYTAIKPNAAKREAEITFRLEKADLHSKARTVKITGFKEKTVAPGTIDIPQNKLLALFGLTETKITASDAAKQIAAAQNTKIDGFLFQEAKAVAYDDKTGTFTVKVTGAKDDKTFDQELTITGFSNPYTNIVPNIVAAELNFSTAIEYNKKIDSFIEDTNNNIESGLQEFIFNDATVGQIEKGIRKNYILTATLKKKEDKIKIQPLYTVKQLKKEKNGNENITEEDCSGVFLRLNKELTKPYFSKNDVFKYLIGKTDDSIIKTDPEEFASIYYAFTQNMNISPGEIINEAKIKDVMNRYNQSGGQYKMEIDTAIYRPRHGGIKADDYAGTIEIEYCIAEKGQIAQMLYDEHMDIPIVAKKKAKAEGFKKVSKENVEELFKFQIKLTANPDAETKWKSRLCTYNNSFLNAEYDINKGCYVYKPNNPFKSATAYYSFTVNGKDPESVFAGNKPTFLPRCADGKKIFIEKISFTKERGSNILKIYIKFLGGQEEIIIEKQPE